MTYNMATMGIARATADTPRAEAELGAGAGADAALTLNGAVTSWNCHCPVGVAEGFVRPVTSTAMPWHTTPVWAVVGAFQTKSVIDFTLASL